MFAKWSLFSECLQLFSKAQSGLIVEMGFIDWFQLQPNAGAWALSENLLLNMQILTPFLMSQ